MLGRHTNRGNYRYRGATEVMDREWQGQSTAADFTLFDPSSPSSLQYTYGRNHADEPVAGGHGILTVAARPNGGATTLLDYVHLRIGGTNPTQAEVLRYINTVLSGRDQNIIHMVRAIFAHESNYTQFQAGVQTRRTMNFRQRHHQNNASQSDCRVRFNFPDDPANHPNVTFDYGVGISQYTKVRNRTISPEVAWDWRHNVNIGLNLFFGHLRNAHTTGIRWRDWARPAWRRYNGSGTQAQQYAQALAASTEGQLVSNAVVPNTVNHNVEAAAVAGPPTRAAVPAWPPPTPAAATAAMGQAASQGAVQGAVQGANP